MSEFTLVRIKFFSEIKDLKICLEHGVGVLELQPQFLKSAAYISRFVKNFRSQFRSFPILQFMRKIKLAIEKIHKNNAKSTIENILSGFPSLLGSGHDLELPTRQYFDYCLAKILAHCQIMVRLVICSKKCALYFVHFLQYGHYIEISTMIIALLGHTWHQARQCLMQMNSFYNKLHSFQGMFDNQKLASKEYAFPDNLGSFIGDDWMEEVDILMQSTAATTSSDALYLLSEIANARQSEDVQRTNPIATRKLKNQKTILSQDDDMGEVISRETLEAVVEVATPPVKRAPEILGKKTLIKFLNTENELRAKGSNKRLTKGISRFHWEQFRQRMESKSKSSENIKSVFDLEWTQLMNKK